MRRYWAAEEFRSVLRLAAPIAVLQTGMVFYNTAATLFVGRLGPGAIATVGLAGSTYTLLFILGLGLLLGIDPISSREFGAGRPKGCAEVLAHAIPLALGVALPIFAALSLSGPLFALVGIEPGLAASAAAYLKVLRWCLFPTLLFAACRQYLQTMNITRPQLAAVLAGNVLNAALDYGWVFGRLGLPELGVVGAAWAMVAANVLMLAVVAAVSWVVARGSGYRFRGFRAPVFAELVRIGLPAGLQLLAEVGAFACVTMLSGRIGGLATAGHQIALNLASLSFMVPLGVSFAAAVRVGQGIGARRFRSAARSGWSALGIGVAFMGLMSAVFVLFPAAVAGLYTQDAATLELGRRLLLIVAFFQIFDGTQVVLTGALRGLGETRIPMAANVVGYWMIGLPVGGWLAFGKGWGVFGLWIGLCLGLCLVALSLLAAWTHRARRLAKDHPEGPAAPLSEISELVR
ncbi:MAG: hypothetical protein A2X36_02685 [Elusimicrobia bacterium GWA2_69_24]|nr:MAG: hypothetical protein A2X36_02685 [Elusimicrobia bacterium GWA2_69_24]HBL16393.1 MATE family efflux transporter [Elusimicrobiota bacterium]